MDPGLPERLNELRREQRIDEQQPAAHCDDSGLFTRLCMRVNQIHDLCRRIMDRGAVTALITEEREIIDRCLCDGKISPEAHEILSDELLRAERTRPQATVHNNEPVFPIKHVGWRD